MRSLLIFANHSKGYISLSAEAYIRELSKHFTDTIFATDHKGPVVLPYTIKYCQNVGYDFGKYYTALKSVDFKKYDRIAFVNDSNFLVGNFDKVFEWGKTCGLEMWGLTDSVEVPRHYNYHVQSHFLVFEKRSIKHIAEFFKDTMFEEKFMKIQNRRENVRQKIIMACEVGLSQYLLKEKIKMGSMWSVRGVPLEEAKTLNLHRDKWEELIKDGYPLIKNKIIIGEWDGIIPNPQNRRKYYLYE